jgi:hypothetical protein
VGSTITEKRLARWCNEHQRWCNSHKAIELDVWIWFERMRQEVNRLANGTGEYFDNRDKRYA